MSERFARRWGAYVALAAGTFWGACSLLSLATDGPDDYLDLLVLVPFGLTLVAVWALNAIQDDRTGRAGRLGFWLSVVAMPAAMIGQLCYVVGIDELAWLGFPVGALAWLIGFLVLGVATARAGVMPTWWGVALALSQPLTMIAGLALSPIDPVTDYGNYSGAIVHAAVWIAFGVLLRTRERTAAPTGPLGERYSQAL